MYILYEYKLQLIDFYMLIYFMLYLFALNNSGSKMV